ncbi:MAG: hypothetical protein PHQ43_09535 [Dehalococcoidales bacterium]|nr:hypothetical protein [Dehalococcoidales bacterium]
MEDDEILGSTGDGIKNKISSRLMEATSKEDLQRIRKELIAEGEKEGSIDAVAHMLRKKGYLKFDSGRLSALPVRLGPRDVIPPEVMIERMKLEDGQYKDGLIDGIGLVFAIARYNQILAATQAEVTETQLKILREAKSESGDVAKQAAEETAARVVSYFDQKKPEPASSPNPMEAMFARQMETVLDRLMGKMFGSGTGQGDQSLPPGWTDQRKGV